jgi:uncharacterized protein (TIGR02453 family)
MDKLFQFLIALKENNHKAWFDQNRKDYEAIKQDWEQTVTQIIGKIAEFEPALGELKAKSCLFRINRDVRFSKDKSPYKTNMGAFFSVGGKKSGLAGYYIHLEPQESFLAGGLWMPEAPKLKSIRQEIDYHLADFKAIVENKDFISTFGKLENESANHIPKGYEKDNPAAEYLKLKSFVGIKKLHLDELNSPAFPTLVAETFQKIKPLNDFLNKPFIEM